ncbi:hypothetical protein EZV62_002650 [Acer yangbiense]|uniref:RING-type domain-containing protein n=1 Tax=Acer yangbiense TaxID=1000413 RepID=A0A5C7IXQ8_9ROSI|nr:hypothetical protein EZV62_002650 [Acer yangbiense]
MPSNINFFDIADLILGVIPMLSTLIFVCCYCACILHRVNHDGRHRDIELGHPRNPPDPDYRRIELSRYRAWASTTTAATTVTEDAQPRVLPEPEQQTFLELCWRIDYEDDKEIARECVICLDEFSDGDECKFGSTCEHIFHKYCIDEWLPKNRRCPLCRLHVQRQL